ncbi:MAG: M20/M25/M40 family metallo-hydrolase [Deltaproteobacteria bacterium]|nr:M20/M25/M40 family metallo-hydrolase [Deltaproteobacteria bacterium]
MLNSWEAVYREATEYLQQLLRIDTTNPPGNERAAIDWLAAMLQREGLTPMVIEAAPGRANLVCRLSVAGPTDGGPLLLTSHVDVVPAEAEKWTHPPFGGVIADGYLWGRGALDMKSKTIMDLMAILSAKREGWKLRRDLIMVALADEEAGMEHGSKFLVEKHPDLILAEYALNEAGGFTVHANGNRLYPIQVAEKGIVWLKIIARGTPGHGSKPHADMAVAKLAHAAARLARRRLPAHVTPPARAFLQALAQCYPWPRRWLLQSLAHPAIARFIAPLLPLNAMTAYPLAMLANTACPTGLHAGVQDAVNVIPSEASVYVDGRILPGQTLDGLLGELKHLVGPGFEYEVLRAHESTAQLADTPLFHTIRQVVEATDPGARAVPFLLTGMTDAYFYKRLGITTYGFQPLKCPADYDLAAQAHAHDERIPVEGFHWGVKTYYEVVKRFITGV